MEKPPAIIDDDVNIAMVQLMEGLEPLETETCHSAVQFNDGDLMALAKQMGGRGKAAAADHKHTPRFDQ